MAKSIGRPKGITGQAATLNASEIKRLLKVMSTGSFTERNVAILTCSYGLGLRAKELASLTWGDAIDENQELRRVLWLKASYTKREKARDVFLSSLLVIKGLMTYTQSVQRSPAAPLFLTRTSHPFTANGMAKLIGHLHREAGFAQASSHSGRRTMITNLAEQGGDLKSIATLAGHASIATTAGYVQDNPVRLAKIMEGVRW